jgi:predicted nucleic acid-binding protein
MLIEPKLLGIARWAARGLTAHDAAYVAVTEEVGARLVADDALLAFTHGCHRANVLQLHG